VVYDDFFTTVTSNQTYNLTETWIDLFEKSRENYLDGHDETTNGPIPDLHEHWLTPDKQAQRTQDASVREGQQQLETPTPPNLTLNNEDDFDNKSVRSDQGEDTPDQGENPLNQGEHPLDHGEHPLD
jgi:hypothetical protein